MVATARLVVAALLAVTLTACSGSGFSTPTSGSPIAKNPPPPSAPPPGVPWIADLAPTPGTNLQFGDKLEFRFVVPFPQPMPTGAASQVVFITNDGERSDRMSCQKGGGQNEGQHATSFTIVKGAPIQVFAGGKRIVRIEVQFAPTPSPFTPCEEIDWGNPVTASKETDWGIPK